MWTESGYSSATGGVGESVEHTAGGCVEIRKPTEKRLAEIKKWVEDKVQATIRKITEDEQVAENRPSASFPLPGAGPSSLHRTTTKYASLLRVSEA